MTQDVSTEDVINEQEMSQPSRPIRMDKMKQWKKKNDDYNEVGDLEVQCAQEDMDHDIPYNICYASEPEDKSPEEELDEEGFTAKEADIFKNVVGWDHLIPLFPCC
jgi:hypothetical protein